MLLEVVEKERGGKEREREMREGEGERERVGVREKECQIDTQTSKWLTFYLVHTQRDLLVCMGSYINQAKKRVKERKKYIYIKTTKKPDKIKDRTILFNL